MQNIDRRTDATALGQWIRAMLTRRHSNLVACALANNQLARIAWAILAKGTRFQPRQALAA